MNAGAEAGVQPLVLVEINDHVATVTLNRGERYNALSMPMIAALEAALDGLGQDIAVRAIVIAARVDQLPHRDIAERFGISARTVEKELRAGLEHCCERMGRDFIQRFGPGAGKTSKHHD